MTLLDFLFRMNKKQTALPRSAIRKISVRCIGMDWNVRDLIVEGESIVIVVHEPETLYIDTVVDESGKLRRP